MIYFKKLKIHLRSLGILKKDPIVKSKIISIALNYTCSVILLHTLFATAGFFLHSARNPHEKSESIHDVLTTFYIFWCHSICIIKSEKYVALFAELDSIVQKSK